MRKIIVYDSDHSGAFENKCFAKEYANKGAGHSFTVELADQGIAKGYEMMTGDVFLKEKLSAAWKAFIMTDMHSERTDQLIRAGAIPFLNFSFESPLIARDFYINIEKQAGRFIHNIQFNGTKERLARTSTQFEVMHFPVSQRVPLTPLAWNKKKYLTIINSNKRVFRTDYSNLKSSVHSLLSQTRFALQKMRDPWMRSKEIYKDRIELIRYFSQYEDFELFGFGWQNRIYGFSNNYHEAAKLAFRGRVGYENKHTTLNQFKFNICFENCAFPGYVTEKIFDSFLSGSIPIYYGAPDILDFVPENTFIDYRKFGNQEALDKHLKGMTEEDGSKMINAAKDFLASKRFDDYYLENFIEHIMDKVEKYSTKINFIKE